MKLERRRSVLELASADRLSEIRSLSRKVEELSVKDEQLGKVQERVLELEVQLERKDCEASWGGLDATSFQNHC